MKNLFKMDLRLFDEPESTGTDNDTSQDGQEGNGKISFDTQADLDSFMDDRINKALETRDDKWKERVKEAEENARTEAQKMAEMDANQKLKYEAEKKEADIAKREAEITTRELKAQAYEQLAADNMPKELIDTLNFMSAEKCTESLGAVKTAFKKAVETGVNERLAQSATGAPKTGSANSTSDNPWDKDSINLTKQGEILKQDPERAKLLQQAAKK